MPKFTDRFLASLKLEPGRKDRLVFDNECRGLGVRVTPRSRAFLVQWHDPTTGRKVREPIGIWGAIILTIIRFIQGLGLGGEWGGSVLLSMEWARSNSHRGFIASWPQFGAPAGFFLANSAVLVFSAISGDQFLSWGWRVPFFLSIIMIGVGLYIRLGILETPTFSRLLAENRIERAPVFEVIKRQPKSIILVALAKMGEMAPAFVYTVFVLTYGTTVLGSSRDLILSALIASGQVAQIPYHLNRAMDNGLTKAQASEMLTQLAFYAGWPNVFSAIPIAKGVFEKRPR